MDLLHNDPWTSKLKVNLISSIFKCFLSYHRWNSPVSGTIVKHIIYQVHTTLKVYIKASQMNGADPVAANDSQAFLTATATRAVIFIKADNPKIGLMFCRCSMSEVSSDEITVRVGQHVNKGDQNVPLWWFNSCTSI